MLKMAQGATANSVCNTPQPKKMPILKSQEPGVVHVFWGQDATRSPFIERCPKHREKGHWWGPQFNFYPPLTSPKTSSEKLLNLSALVFPQPQNRGDV